MQYGLSEQDIKDTIHYELDKNPDLKYYINNPYFEEYISLLIDGISSAIVQNTNKVIEDIEYKLKNGFRF